MGIAVAALQDAVAQRGATRSAVSEGRDVRQHIVKVPDGEANERNGLLCHARRLHDHSPWHFNVFDLRTAKLGGDSVAKAPEAGARRKPNR